MLIALPVAYALGRLDFRGRTAMLFAIITTRSYPPIAIIIPFVYSTRQVGLQGTMRGLVIIYLTLTIPMIVWVMTSFFSSLPRTVEAAARVDGNTRWQAFYRVILPMSWPGIAVATAISFMVCWNEFVFSQFLTAGSDAQTLPAGDLDLVLPDLAADRDGRRLDHRHHPAGDPGLPLPEPHPQSESGRSAVATRRDGGSERGSDVDSCSPTDGPS